MALITGEAMLVRSMNCQFTVGLSGPHWTRMVSSSLIAAGLKQINSQPRVRPEKCALSSGLLFANPWSLSAISGSQKITHQQLAEKRRRMQIIPSSRSLAASSAARALTGRGGDAPVVREKFASFSLEAIRKGKIEIKESQTQKKPKWGLPR